MNKLLEVENLKIGFGHKAEAPVAVNDVSFSMEPGKTTVLLGESGCGKSITALSIIRLLPPAANVMAGNVKLDGLDLFSLAEVDMRKLRGNRISMIFQEPQSSLNPVLTAGQQIGETLALHKGLKGTKLTDRVIELLDAVGIPEPDRRIHEYPHQFSGGMKQRIMIAMALAGEPELLIADEPTTALDVTIQAQVLDLLQNLQQQTGMGILFITHDLGVAKIMSDQVEVMYEGSIVESAGNQDFFTQAKHDYSRHLFNSLPDKGKRDAEHRGAKSEDADKLLQVNQLKVHFPIKKGLLKRTVGYVKAVDGVSIDIRQGETVAIVGESGSGKTTMGKGILQLLKPTAGEIIFDGNDLSDLSAADLRKMRSDIQIVFQDPFSSMNPRMMIKDILEEGMLAQGVGGDKSARLQRCETLMQQVGLDKAHLLRYPHEFSGGQRQRICIARAIAVEPKLIICDEPTSALDVSVQAQILDLLRQLQDELNLAYLFITHNISVVEYLADQVAVMYKGEIVEQGSVDQVIYQPQHPYTQKLLAAVPRLETIPV